MREGLFAFATLAALGGCGEAQKSFDANYDKKFRESCVSSAMAKGVPSDAAKRVCDCTMDEINKRFSTSEKLTTPDEKLLPIMDQCVKSVVTNNG